MKKILKYLIILGILQSKSNASSEPPSAASVDISDGLVAHYPFSGDANDQSGNNHHLENRGATLTSDRFGMKESAYAFDGIPVTSLLILKIAREISPYPSGPRPTMLSKAVTAQ